MEDFGSGGLSGVRVFWLKGWKETKELFAYLKVGELQDFTLVMED